jgi:hypothetical protein
MLFLIIGALVILSSVLSYRYYIDHKKPSGVQIDIGKEGVSIEQK